jgi:hypothetical protein
MFWGFPLVNWGQGAGQTIDSTQAILGKGQPWAVGPGLKFL